jgi:GNAT superfamily N-acetyltransferase
VQWLPLWTGYNAFYGRAGETALAEGITETTWSRFLDADEPVHGLAAEHNGRLVGIAHYLFHRNTNAIEPSCYLQDLFTAEAARGKGVGRALIEAVYRAAKQAGASRVYWHTHETNAAAIVLYEQMAERSGFIVFRKMFEP